MSIENTVYNELQLLRVSHFLQVMLSTLSSYTFKTTAAHTLQMFAHTYSY